MSRLSQKVRRTTKQGKMFPATVLDHGGGKATVRLSTNGAIYRMLPLVGGPVTNNQAVYVDFNTDPPQVVAPGEDVLDASEPRTRTRVAPRGTPLEPEPLDLIILDPSGQGGEGGDPSLTPPTNPVYTYEVDDDGFETALLAASGSPGSVIYLPDCDLQGYSTMTFLAEDGLLIPTRTTIIGESRSTSIVRHPLLLQEGCVLRNLRVNITTTNTNQSDIPAYLHNMYEFAVIGYGDCTVQDCDLWVTTTTTGGSGAAVTNDISCRMILNNCSIKCSNATNTAYGVLAGGQFGSHFTVENRWMNLGPMSNEWLTYPIDFDNTYPENISLAELADRFNQRYVVEIDTDMLVDGGPDHYENTIFVHWFPGVTRIPPKLNSISAVEAQYTVLQGNVAGRLRQGGQTEEPNQFSGTWNWTLVPDGPDYDPELTDEALWNAQTHAVSGGTVNVPFTVSYDFPSEMHPSIYFTRSAGFEEVAVWPLWYMPLGFWVDAWPHGLGVVKIQLNYVKATGPNGLEHYLFPKKGYFYINNCTFDCEGPDIDMRNDGYCEVTGNAQGLTTDGTVVFRNVGQQPVSSGSEPPATFPGQWWLQE